MDFSGIYWMILDVVGLGMIRLGYQICCGGVVTCHEFLSYNLM